VFDGTILIAHKFQTADGSLGKLCKTGRVSGLIQIL